MNEETTAIIGYIADKMLTIMNNNRKDQSIINDKMITNLDKTVDQLNQATKMIVTLTKRVQELEEKIQQLTEEPSVEELCNNVIVAADQGDDDFMSAYLELTNALKAEVRQDIENEKDII